MDRRTYLSAAGVGGAAATTGCLRGVFSLIQTYSEGIQRRVAVVSQGSPPEASNLSIEVALPTPTVTGDHPARLRITSTNVGEEKLGLNYGAERCAILNRDGCRSDPRALWLSRPATENWKRVGRNANAWMVDRTGNWFGYGCVGELAPGESYTSDYFVVDNGQGGPYLPPGEYRWAEELGVDVGTPYEYPPDVSFDWGFTLAVRKP